MAERINFAPPPPKPDPTRLHYQAQKTEKVPGQYVFVFLGVGLRSWIQGIFSRRAAGAPEVVAGAAGSLTKVSDERSTLLFLLDVLSRNLVEIEGRSARKTRDQLDDFAKELISGKADVEDSLFRFRMFFSNYRVEEYAYVSKSFEDFKNIIWSFVDQLSDDVGSEKAEDAEVKVTLQEFKAAVDTGSAQALREKSLQFINFYSEHQTKREARQKRRMSAIKKSLDAVKKQLTEVTLASQLDHLTQAFNRRCFDEQIKKQISLFSLSQTPVCLLMIDIDYFKKVNDTHGHDVGDFVLKECVRVLQEIFKREGDFVARIGGEEFAVILPGHALEHAAKRAEELTSRLRNEVFVINDKELRFTISGGIAQLHENETGEQWIKHSDIALLESKGNGRNRFTVSPHPILRQVA